jgi:hypothetical protein
MARDEHVNGFFSANLIILRQTSVLPADDSHVPVHPWGAADATRCRARS